MPQVELILGAVLMAQKIGRPLNRHVTVHWGAGDVQDAGAAAATTAFLKYFRDWLAGEVAYVWVRENGDLKGTHLHILAHLPAGRRMIGARSRRWLAGITGKPYRCGMVRTRRIAGSNDPDGPVYAVNLNRVLAYVLKGADAEAALAFGIEREPGGLIIGKRCGTSRNIGAKAARGHAAVPDDAFEAKMDDWQERC